MRDPGTVSPFADLAARVVPDPWMDSWLDADPADTQLRIELLDGFRVLRGQQIIRLGLGCQRVLALLELAGHALQREFVAFTLWPDKTEERAQGNLRSVLWRIRRTGLGLVETDGKSLSIGREVSSDRDVIEAVARRLLEGQRPTDGRVVLRVLTTGDLLPDWYDEWVEAPRESLRQTRLHALEALSSQLRELGDLTASVEAGLAAVAAEPRRESAHREVVLTHLAEGNPAEALRQYERYRFLAHTELGILPSEQMERLVEPLRPHAVGR